MIKCIATDMDGTLLNEQQEISKANQEALKAAQHAGIHVVVATGRAYYEAEKVLKEAELTCPIICTNGAEVRNEAGEKVYSTPIPKLLALQVMRNLEKIGVYYEVYTNSGTYTESKEMGIEVLVNVFLSANPSMSREDVEKEASKRFDDGMMKTVPYLQELTKDDAIEVYKLLVFSKDPSQLEEAKTVVSNEELALSSSGMDNLEINHKDAQKGIALAAHTKRLGISMKDTMALGDQLNDLSMFQRVGHAVAMGNAVMEAKEVAHEVTATNKEDGVAKAVQKILQLTKPN
ncbi:Cof-type HAD-IIB family hydrolase [Bacillus fonticola]|uniref:Cof-type HAD-IIB family hydrolase n=1 Tax=Bacillus fonticola TaxID=2728853 RepID=UPI001476420D|nr:Cof-type HAD-IIB family hydrolase [Bacillus fonticola]